MVIAVVVVLLLPDQLPEDVKEIIAPRQTTVRLDQYLTDDIVEVFLIKNDKEAIGVIQRVNCQGYNGVIQLLVKIGIPEKNLNSIEVINHSETPNYGGYLSEEWFLKRFIGKTADQELRLVKIVDQTPDEIVTITGASKTSQGVLSGINQSFQNFNKIYGGIKNE